MTTTETFPDVLADARIAIDIANSAGRSLPNDDVACILDRIESALASAEPVAWSRTEDITDDNGCPIGTDEPRLVWGSEHPDPSETWFPLYGGPMPATRDAKPAAKVEAPGRDAGPSFDDVCRAIRAYGLACIDLGMEGMRPSSETPASVPGGWRDHGNSALAHISNALDDLDSSPDQRPVPLLNEAMFHIREMLSPTNQEGAAP